MASCYELAGKSVLHEYTGTIESGKQALPIVSSQMDIYRVSLSLAKPMDIKKEPQIGDLPADLVNIAPYPVVRFKIKWPHGRSTESAFFFAIGIDEPPAILRYHYIWRESYQIENLLSH